MASIPVRLRDAPCGDRAKFVRQIKAPELVDTSLVPPIQSRYFFTRNSGPKGQSVIQATDRFEKPPRDLIGIARLFA